MPEYDIKYLGHVKVDEITAYVFCIRPKEIEKNRQYFQGVVWVDDRDLQIVKSEGKQVPQDKIQPRPGKSVPAIYDLARASGWQVLVSHLHHGR